MTITLHHRDLPADLDLGPIVAIDCEAMGLNHMRDRLTLVQLSSGDGTAHLVQIESGQTEAPHLSALLTDYILIKIVFNLTWRRKRFVIV